MPPTTKTFIFGTFLLFGGLIAKNVYANGHGSCHEKKAMYHKQAIKAISKDVDLKPDQKEMWLDFKEEIHQDRMTQKKQSHPETKSFHPKHHIHKNLQALISNTTDAQSIHNKIEAATSQISSHIDEKQEKLISILDILETYDQEQREQALDNLDNLEMQREAHLEKRTDILYQKLDRIFDGVSISEDSLNQLKNLHDDGLEEKEMTKQRMVAYLEGTMTKEDVISEMEHTSTQVIEHLHRTVNVWDEVLTDLSQKDRQKIVSNWNLLKQEHISSCAPHKQSPKQKHRK